MLMRIFLVVCSHNRVTRLIVTLFLNVQTERQSNNRLTLATSTDICRGTDIQYLYVIMPQINNHP